MWHRAAGTRRPISVGDRLLQIGAEDVHVTAVDVGRDPVELDDEGKVLMRNGWYRLSEASRKRKHLQDSSNSIK